jgi:hypothetical protein
MGDRAFETAVKIEFATSPNNPAFRLYRVAGAPGACSFIGDASSEEQLVIFDGDEVKAKRLRDSTAFNLLKLSDLGQRVARGLFPLPFQGIYIAIDQLQLIASDAAAWSDGLEQGVAGALREAWDEPVELVELAWRALMAPVRKA